MIEGSYEELLDQLLKNDNDCSLDDDYIFTDKQILESIDELELKYILLESILADFDNKELESQSLALNNAINVFKKMAVIAHLITECVPEEKQNAKIKLSTQLIFEETNIPSEITDNITDFLISNKHKTPILYNATIFEGLEEGKQYSNSFLLQNILDKCKSSVMDFCMIIPTQHKETVSFEISVGKGVNPTINTKTPKHNDGVAKL